MAGINFVARDDIEARLRCAGADRGSKAVIDDRLCLAHGQQHVFLYRNIAHALRSCITHMAMGVDQPGHQRRATAVDDGRTLSWQFLAPLGNALNAVALNQHFAWRCRLPYPVENSDIGE